LKKNFSAIGLVVVCLLLTACHIVPDAAKDGAGGYTVTDSQGTVVTVPAKPHRIVTLSMSTDEVMLGLVPPSDMAAVNSLLDDSVSSNVVDLAKKVEKRVGNPTVEEIVALSPDLVIVPDWGDLAIVPSLREAGLTVVVCKGARNLAEIKETIVLLAQAAGVPERGEKLLAMMDEHLKDIEKKVSAIPESERKTVVLISLMSGYGGIGSRPGRRLRVALAGSAGRIQEVLVVRRGVVDQLGEEDRARRGRWLPRPPQVQGGRVPLADGLLPTRLPADLLQGQCDLDELLLRHGRPSGRSRSMEPGVGSPCAGESTGAL